MDASLLRTFFVADEKQGEEKSYRFNGRLATQANYAAGELHGLSQNWNEQGVLVFEGEYKEGCAAANSINSMPTASLKSSQLS